MSYESVYGEISSQRSQIQQRRQQLSEPILSGSAKQQRIMKRRLVRDPEFQTYQRQRRSELESLEQAESKLSGFESKVRGYEKKGYKVKRTDKGLEFSKEVVTGGGGGVHGDYSILVKWRKGSGEVVTTQTKASRLGEFPSGSVISVESLGGGRSQRTPEMRTTEKGFMIWEAPKIQETGPVYQPDHKQIGELQVTHIGMDKKQNLGFDRQQPKTITTTDAELALIRQKDYNKYRTDLTREITNVAMVNYDKYIAEGGKPYTDKPPKPSEIVTYKYGSERLDIYVAKHLQDLGIPALIAGVQTITGLDSQAWENLHQQYASEILESTRRKGESMLSYTGRFWTSPQAISNVYIPAATFGISYVAKPFQIGIKTIPTTSKLFSVTSRLSYYAPKISKITIGLATVSTGYQVVANPKTAALSIGRTLSGFGKIYGGYYLGGKFYTATHPKLMQQSYWTGTEYEQNILDITREKSIIKSQYKPYEFGHPSTHYTAEIKPVWQKYPYVPKIPSKINTFTLGFKNPENPYQGFFIKRNILSSRDFGVYETSPVSVKLGEDEYVLNMVSGETTFKGSTSRVIGFQSSKYVGDIGSDATVSKMYGYSLTDYARPVITKGTSVSKTFYGEGSKWAGNTIKFFKQGKDYEQTISFSMGRTKGFEIFDVSTSFKPPIKIKSYFAGGIGFDYSGLPETTIKDFVLPGGIKDTTSYKINLKGPFGSQIKPVNIQDYYDTPIFISKYWSGKIPTMSNVQSIVQLDLVKQKQYGLQKRKYDTILKTISINLNINRDIQSQFNVSQSLNKQMNQSLSKQENISQSLTKQLQLQKQRQQQKLRQITINTPLNIPVLPPQSPYQPNRYIREKIFRTPPPPPPPPFIFDLPKDGKTKKPKKKSMVDWSRGYRYRSWKVPTLKQLLDIKT